MSDEVHDMCDDNDDDKRDDDDKDLDEEDAQLDSPLLALLGHLPGNEWPSKNRFIARQPCPD